MKGPWYMGRSGKIDCRRFYEADFFGFDPAMSKKVLMVENNLFSTQNRALLIPSEKGEPMIVD